MKVLIGKSTLESIVTNTNPYLEKKMQAQSHLIYI